MLILGLSGGHDANWCVCRGGEILGAFEKERFTRKRHDTGEVLAFVPATLESLGVTPADIDIIATSEPVKAGQDPGHRVLGGRSYTNLTDWQWQTAEFFGRAVPCLSVPHHLAHAAYARYTSPFSETAVMTLDGGGDWDIPGAKASTTVSSWRGTKLEWIAKLEDSDFGSLWFSYSNAIFGDPHAAGKLMGLAALGSDRLAASLADAVLRPVREVLSGAWTVKDCWQYYDHPLLLSDGADWQDPVAQDVAFAVQSATTQAGLTMASSLHSATGLGCLALAGGVALNGYLNSEIARHSGFERTFVPPAVNDGGIALGAALFAAYNELGFDFEPSTSRVLEFLGAQYGTARAAFALHRQGVSAAPIDQSDAITLAAEALSRGEFVAWYEGRSEHGPRALGHRSILSSPLDDGFRTRLNRDVKFRERFRPVAPVIGVDDVRDYFDLAFESPFMMFIVDATERTRRSAPAAVHVDGTARVQTVRPESSLGAIVTEFGKLTGIPMVINTSLNVRSPIVETPDEALSVFCSAPIDFLYLEGFLIRKQKE